MFSPQKHSFLSALVLVLALPAASPLAAQRSEPYIFKPVTIGAGGYVPGLVAHPTAPGVIYARTDIGGVYRWNAWNSTWTPLTDFHSSAQYNLNDAESIALDPSAYSTNGGTSWTPFPTCALGGNYSNNGGIIAVDASGTSIMWSTSYNPVQFSLDKGNTWTATEGIPCGAVVYADKVTPNFFYAYANYGAGANFYSGTVDTARNTAIFTQVNTTALPPVAGCYGSGCGVVDTDFAKAGDLWIPLSSNGLWHSTDGGVTWTQAANAPCANSAAVGAPSPWTRQNAVFLYGEAAPSDAMAIYRSDDNGQSWVRVNDDAHQYGGPTRIQADLRVYGRVYLGMNGRGIIYGDTRHFRAGTGSVTANEATELEAEPNLVHGCPIFKGVD